MSREFNYVCKNEECEHEFNVSYFPGRPAQTYGPPEKCYPEEPPEWEPFECLKCGEPVDPEEIDQQLRDDYDSWADAQYDAWKEQQMLDEK